MRFVFDCRFIRHDHHDGISRFSSELFTEVNKLIPTTALISDRRQLGFLPEGIQYIFANDPRDGIRELFIAKSLNKFGATHVFSPMQTMGSWGRKYKLVLTLHDLIYYTHKLAPPALAPHIRIAWRIYHQNFLLGRALLNRADSVVTVSLTSKELIERNKLTTKPVHVIYNAPASNQNLASSSSPKTVSGRNKLLYMGSFMIYKNVECLVDAMKQLPDFELVCLSKVSVKRKHQLQARAGEASDRVIFRDGVSDAEYLDALEESFALVSASKDEGFGIPIVEAMRQGIPVLISDIPIFREIASGAGTFFDPNRPGDFVSQIKKLAVPSVWQAASQESLKRANFFSWEDSAKKLLKALN
jgi:glycosyltransferase involved in cell wall biosynthesis